MTAFVWMGPLNGYIFGTDSIQFVNLFTYNNNPLFLFSYTSNPVGIIHGSQDLFFIYILDKLLTFAFQSYAFAEHLIIFLLILIQSMGMLSIFQTISEIKPERNGISTYFGGAIGAIFYTYNPYTLSVIYPSLQGWTFFYCFLPFFVNFVLRVHYLGETDIKRLLSYSLIAIFLAPGLGGPYTVSIGYMIAFFVFVEFLQLVTKVRTRLVTFRRISFLILGLITFTFWITIPFLINSGIPSSFPNNNLIELFLSESQTTSLLKVSTLVAYGWIYFAPSSYPWIHWLPLLSVFSLLLIPLFGLGVYLIGKRTNLLAFTLFIIIILFLSIGFNEPVANFNLALFKLKGPFLLLANPYYFIGEFYVVFLSISIFIITSVIINYLVTLIRSRRFHFASVASGIKSLRKTKVAIYLISLFMILAMLSAYMSPFVTNEVYNTTGPNSREFVVPNSFNELSTFFNSNYTGPNYYSLILPMGSGKSIEMKLGNSTYTDDVGLINSYVPYNNIWANKSPYASSIENLLASNNLSNLGTILTAFHIRYVVYNPFVNLSYSTMLKSPNGNYYNFSYIYSSLNKSLGDSIHIGKFIIWKNAFATPITEILNNPVMDFTTNLSTYLNFLQSINQSSSVLASEIAKEPATFQMPTLSYFRTYRFIGPQFNSMISGNHAYVVYNNGTVETSYNHSISDTLLSSHRLNSTLSANTSYYRTPIITNNFSKSSLLVTLNMSLSSYSNSDNLIGFSLFSKNDNINGSLIVSPLSHRNIYLQLVAQNNLGQDLAWSNTFLPNNVLFGNITLYLKVTKSLICLSMKSSNNTYYTDYLYINGKTQLSRNPGYNLSVWSPNMKLGNSTIYFQDNNFQIEYGFLKSWTPLPLKYIVTSQKSFNTDYFYPNVSYNDFEDYSFHTPISKNVTIIVVSYPYTPIVSLSSGKNIIQNKLNGTLSNVFLIRGNNSNESFSIKFNLMYFNTALEVQSLVLILYMTLILYDVFYRKN